jgi:hypothetical protein
VGAGTYLSEILEVSDARWISASTYIPQERYGVTPEQAEELLRAGVKPEDYAKGVEQGLTYSEILEVSRRGVNLSEYLHLRKYGITLRGEYLCSARSTANSDRGSPVGKLSLHNREK